MYGPNTEGFATVTAHMRHEHAPVLSEGTVDPAVLRKWDLRCTEFLAAQSPAVKDEDKVRKIIPGILHTAIRDHVDDMDHAIRDTITYEEFMKEIRLLFLKPNWQDDAYQSLYTARMKPTDDFLTWIGKLKRLNALLIGEDQHMSPKAFQSHIVSCVYDVLRDRIKDNKEVETVAASYALWANKIGEIDGKLKRERAENLDLCRALLREEDEKKKRASPTSSRSTHTPGTPPRKKIKTTGSTPAMGSTERGVLIETQGCYKCRIPHNPHLARNCTRKVPIFVPVTKEIAEKIRDEMRKQGARRATQEIALKVKADLGLQKNSRIAGVYFSGTA